MIGKKNIEATIKKLTGFFGQTNIFTIIHSHNPYKIIVLSLFSIGVAKADIPLGGQTLKYYSSTNSTVLLSQEHSTIYSWYANGDVVAQQGGTIVQHNSTSVSRINYLSSNYHTINVVGKKESIDKEDNSLASVYFLLTLDSGNTFHGGDKITITAMRNNDQGGKANLYLLFDNGASITDTCEWANLGLLHEINIGASSESSSSKSCRRSNASTEPLGQYSLEPSTNTFVVPAEASGSSSLRLTRNESQCMLYITSLVITRSEDVAGITVIRDDKDCGDKEYRFGPLIIKNGKKYIVK